MKEILKSLETASVDEQREILKTVDFHKLDNLEKDALVDFLSTCDENLAIDYVFFVLDNIEPVESSREPFTVAHINKLKPLFTKAKDICEDFAENGGELRNL